MARGAWDRCRRNVTRDIAWSDRRRCFARVVAVAGLAAAMVGCGAIVDRFSGRSEACAVLGTGTPATATVVRLIDTGITINDNPVVEFVLRVELPGGPAYEARTRALVSRLDVPAVQPGRSLPVKYDPQQPSRVAIDRWDCAGA